MPAFASSFAAALKWLWRRRVLEFGLLVFILGLLTFDRVRVSQEYLFKYTDEDQALEWNAAHDLLQGRVHEPCFWGQSYNSCLEGYLAAPLVKMGVSYPVAVPCATVFLGLFPFLVIGAVAWRRGQTVIAGLALVVPVLLPTRYAMITGMPRGFVTGVALAVIPAMLLLPRRPRRLEGREVFGPAARAGLGERRWDIGRYAVAAFLSVAAMMLNPNAAVLLVAVAVYAVLTRFLQWRFWVGSVVGVLAAAPYPLFVYYFYYVWHDDYRLYLRTRVFEWTRANLTDSIGMLDMWFRDFVPAGLASYVHGYAGDRAVVVLVVVLAVVLVLLVLRLRIAGILAGLSGLAVVVTSLAYDRIHEGRPGVSFPYTRMFLAVPVLLLWLMMLINSTPRGGLAGIGRWKGWGVFAADRWPRLIACVLLAGLCAWGYVTEIGKDRVLVSRVQTEVAQGSVARPVPVAEVERVAGEVQRMADATHASMVLVGGPNGRKWVYALAALTNRETLLPSFERRTWRLYEEEKPRHEVILLLGIQRDPADRTFAERLFGADDPTLSPHEMKGESVIDYCERNNIRTRPFGVSAKDADDWPG